MARSRLTRSAYWLLALQLVLQPILAVVPPPAIASAAPDTASTGDAFGGGSGVPARGGPRSTTSDSSRSLATVRASSNPSQEPATN
jgi:hypothetical protein